MSDRPLVSIVTPVYNGGDYLQDCIRSVREQTYDNWEHVVLDNASTDNTAATLREWAAADGRVQIFANPHTLPIMENWNEAFRKISPESDFTVILPADDYMYPGFLERLLDLAGRHPSAGVIGCCVQRGDRVEGTGLPRERELFPGKEVTRLFLRQEVFSLSPIGSLIRSDLVRERHDFMPGDYLHADLAALFEVLDRTDFAFSYEVLFYSRVHLESMTAKVAVRRRTLLRDWLMFIEHYGPRYFSAEELKQLREQLLRRYYRILVRGFVTAESRDFFSYHLDTLRRTGHMPGIGALARAAGAEVAAVALHPYRAWRMIRGRLLRNETIAPWDITAHP